MHTEGNQLASGARIQPFRDWCGAIDPRVLLDESAFKSTIVAPRTAEFPDGVPAKYHTWEFPEHWFPRGSRATRCLQFGKLEVLAGNSAPGLKLVLAVKQYTVGAMTLPERALSLPTIRRRCNAAIRLATAVLKICHGKKTFSDLSLDDALEVVREARTNSNDDEELGSVLTEVNEYGEAGLVCDYFRNVDWKRSFLSSLETLSKFADRFIDETQAIEKPKAARPLPDPYTERMIEIAIFYIEVISKHIIRHAEYFGSLRKEVLMTKGCNQSKKLALRKVWKKYKKFAISDLSNWKTKDGAPICTLPFEHDYAFPPRRLKHLLVLVSNLQMCSFQLVALDGAMRLGEQHTLGIDQTYLLDVLGKLVPIARGMTFKTTGGKGCDGCEWAITYLALRALDIQKRLFAAFESRSTVTSPWRETKPGSIGAPMRSAELIHLNTFARRHNLLGHCENGRICHRQFRKTFARLMAKFADEGVKVVRQQLKHSDDQQTSDYILADPVTGIELVGDTLLANGLTADQIKEIFDDK
jgi:hypothetical protein